MIGHGGTPESEQLKFAFLEYERVGASYSIASQLHMTYAADVERIVSRLEAATNKREALQMEISEMESSLAECQRETQKAGRELSDSLFGAVLRSVGSLHRSLTATHEALRQEANAIKEGGPPADKDRLLAFRQGLNMMDGGLTMDGPLKTQLEALESRDARAAQELTALQTRKDLVTMLHLQFSVLVSTVSLFCSWQSS